MGVDSRTLAETTGRPQSALQRWPLKNRRLTGGKWLSGQEARLLPESILGASEQNPTYNEVPLPQKCEKSTQLPGLPLVTPAM